MLKLIGTLNGSALMSMTTNSNKVVDGNDLEPILFQSKKTEITKSKKSAMSKTFINSFKS